MIKLALFSAIAVGSLLAAPQEKSELDKKTNLPEHREQVVTEIPGAPILSQPKWIRGTELEIRTEKHGLIYPLFYDWNRDGKKDLLLGEFETGDTGSYVKVFLNEGTTKEPKYSGKFTYATDTEGNKITNHQWCCIGIHPRLVDLDNDGHLDLVSGQYNPGLISWWRGSKEGFLPRVFVPQEGYKKGIGRFQSAAPWTIEAFSYWNYTSADFGDFNGDGLLDLFVGGSDGPRVALNIGTKEQPKFGLRRYLLGLDGHPLKISTVENSQIEYAKKNGQYVNLSGVGKSYVHPVDWDSDGVLDLIVTHEYKKKSHNPVEFFRGHKTKFGLRFAPKVALFSAKDGKKSLPGVQPMISVTDYNGDGVRDLLIGLSVPTVNGFEFAKDVAWDYPHDLKIQMPGKDAGRSLKYYGGLEGAIKKMEEQKFLKSYLLGNLKDKKYLTMRHRGYPMVLLGKKNPVSAKVKIVEAKPEVKRTIISNENTQTSKLDGPVSYSITVPQRATYRRTYEATVTINFEENWHGYADTEANRKSGKIPTTATFTFPKGVELVGKTTCSQSGPTYHGEVTFTQKFQVPLRVDGKFNPLKELETEISIQFQTCDINKCLPPENQTTKLKSTLRWNRP